MRDASEDRENPFVFSASLVPRIIVRVGGSVFGANGGHVRSRTIAHRVAENFGKAVDVAVALQQRGCDLGEPRDPDLVARVVRLDQQLPRSPATTRYRPVDRHVQWGAVIIQT
ncbi:MAG: hypothetical protein AAFY53_15710, partial [Pseudomonadota bacterium]